MRAATPGDIDAIAAVWHAAWCDGHIGHVPDGLLPERTLDEFRRRVPQRIATSIVAEAAEGENAEGDGGPESGEAVRELQTDGESGFQKSGHDHQQPRHVSSSRVPTFRDRFG